MAVLLLIAAVLCIYVYISNVPTKHVYLPQNNATYKFNVNTFFYDRIDINSNDGATLFMRNENTSDQHIQRFSCGSDNERVQVSNGGIKVARLYSNTSGIISCDNEHIVLELLWTSPVEPVPGYDIRTLNCEDMEILFDYRIDCALDEDIGIQPNDPGSHNLLIMMFCPRPKTLQIDSVHHSVRYTIDLKEMNYIDVKQLPNGTLPLSPMDLFSIKPTGGSEVYVRVGERNPEDNYININEVTLKYHRRHSTLIGCISIGTMVLLLLTITLFVVSVRLRRR